MKGKDITFIFAIVFSIAFGSFYALKNKSVFVKTKKSEVIKKTFSTNELAKKAHIESSSVISSKILLASELKQNKNFNNDEKVSTLKEDYEKNFLMPLPKIASQLNLIEKQHKELMNKMLRDGQKIDPVTRLRPRLAITLTLYLNLQMGSLKQHNIEEINLTSKEWYILKTFSESNDFKIMLKRDTLNSDFLQIDNLVNYYASN